MSRVSRIDPQGSRAKRARNLAQSLKLLDEQGFAVIQHSPTHFRIEIGACVADFWPTTGQYRVRPNGRYSRGVFNLMRDMRAHSKAP